ncbi:hypothetical protein BJ875DRAFT_503324 [Amylocarpus encephaloides]|uniref:Diphthamide biosynthesis protein 4 n=1 Tax=Amylocarpus encephaloides TaxID=45428 RepID=A0A9P8C7M3_9HELO|nr:hypothetical protein BJ875DRAFT_503324 [Amylocarpus encephaloides]
MFTSLRRKNLLSRCEHSRATAQSESTLDGSMTRISTHYEVLGLPSSIRNEPVISARPLRNAYRRALLQNHPDKSPVQAHATPTSRDALYSIDQITEAYNTLSSPKLRATYDNELRLQRDTTRVGGVKGKQEFHTGVETVDLEDLEVDEDQGVWHRSCRCGDERGFLMAESDLEEAADDGELNVGCRGCSLWLKVLFGVIEDENHQETAQETANGDQHENLNHHESP